MLPVAFASPHGPRFSNDLVTYSAGAENVLHGHYPQTLSHSPLTLFPPGMSVCIALLSFFTGSIFHATVALELLSQFLVVLLSYFLFRQLGVKDALAVCLTAVIALNSSLLYVTSMALSEGPMTAAVFAAIICSSRLHKSKVHVRDVLLVAMFVDLAFCFRYAGIVVIPAVAMSVAGWSEKRWKPALTVAATSAIVPVIIVAHNIALDGSVFGPRFISDQTVGDVAFQTYSAVFRSAPGSHNFVSGPLAIAQAAFVTVTAAALVFLFLRKAWHVAGVRALVYFVSLYMSLLVFSELHSGMDTIDVRLLMPCAVAVCALLGVALTRMHFSPRAINTAVAIYLVLSIVGSARLAVLLHSNETRRSLAEGDTAAVVQQLQYQNGVIASDAAARLWMAGYRGRIIDAPKHREYRSIEAGPTFMQFSAAAHCQEATAVLYGYDGFYSADELVHDFDVTAIDHFGRITVVHIARSNGTCA